MASKLWLDLARKKVFSSSSSYSLLCNNVYMRSKKSSIRSEKAAAAAVIWRKYFSSSASAAAAASPRRPGTQVSASSSSSSQQGSMSSYRSSSFPILVLRYPSDDSDTESECQKTVNVPYISLAEDVGGARRWMKKVMRKKLPHMLSELVYECSHGLIAYVNPIDCGLYLANFFFTNNPSSSAEEEAAEIIYLPSTDINPATDPNFVHKVFLPNSPFDNNNEQVLVIIIYGIDAKLAFCRLGDSWWTPLESPLTDYKDIIYSQKSKLFYALNYYGEIESWDFHQQQQQPQRIERKINFYPVPQLSNYQIELRSRSFQGGREYLVESPSGQILRIAHHYAFCKRYDDDDDDSGEFKYCHYDSFDVYKLDFEQQRAEYVDNLGDTAIFLDWYGHSFALSVTANDHQLQGLKPNSIYFGNWHFNCRDDELYGTSDTMVYNLENRTVAPWPAII